MRSDAAVSNVAADDRVRLTSLEEQLGDAMRALLRAQQRAGPRRGEVLAVAARVQVLQREARLQAELAEARESTAAGR